MKKNPATIIVSVLVLLFLALLVLYTLPARDRIAEFRAQVSALEAEALVVQADVDRLTSLKEILPKGEVQRLALTNAVPLALQQDRLLTELHTIATTHNIAFDSLSMSTVDNVLTKVSAVSLSSTFTGNYEDLVAFLEGLESASRRIEVKSINVQLLPSEEGHNDEKPRASFSVTMEAYYQMS